MNYYVMTCVEHYRSQWNTIRANAASFTGFLLGNLPVEKRRASNLNPTLVSRGTDIDVISKSNDFPALIDLLKERDPAVRKAAADSMALMHNY